jgi:hypothetical protein
MAFINNFSIANIQLATHLLRSYSSSNILFISHDAEQKSFGEDGFIQLLSFESVKEYYLPNTRTYKMLQHLLSNPAGNITNANGSVFVFKTTSTNATQSSFKTADLTDNLNNLIAVSNGALKVIIKKGTENIKEVEYTNINLTNFTTLAEIVAHLNSQSIYKFELIDGKQIKITNPVFGAGYSIELAASTSNPLVHDDLIDIRTAIEVPAIEVPGVDSNITDLQNQLQIASGVLKNDKATSKFITTIDLSQTHIDSLATALQTNFGTTEEVKQLFFYGISATNPLAESIQNDRNTKENFKTFFTATATKDNETLHYLSSSLLAKLLRSDTHKVDNNKVNIHGNTLLTNNDIKSLPILLDVKLYKEIGKNLLEKGMNYYAINGSVKQFAFGKFQNGDNMISIEKAVFKYNFENFANYYNSVKIFNNESANFNADVESGVILSIIYGDDICEILKNNNVVVPFVGNQLPFTITQGKPQATQENELNDLQTKGYFVLLETITDEDKINNQLRFAFLLHTPQGLQKIVINGIAFN